MKTSARRCKRSRAVALLSRKLEDIPTRAELIQYERRFDELFDTVQAKLKETRKYFAAHNVLADTKKYLLKEISLLDSVHRQVRPALETVNGKASLVTALESIRSGVEANVRLVEEKLSSRETPSTPPRGARAAAPFAPVATTSPSSSNFATPPRENPNSARDSPGARVKSNLSSRPPASPRPRVPRPREWITLHFPPRMPTPARARASRAPPSASTRPRRRRDGPRDAVRAVRAPPERTGTIDPSKRSRLG